MKQTKRRLEIFSFFNQRGICAHLESMAQKGWMISEITNMGWVYRRMEPKQLHFAVSYYPKASAFDPEPSEQQRQLHDFCAHTGWQLACTSAQLQIFYNEQENPTPIETEPELELEAIHATAKKSLLPAYYLLLGIALLQGLMFLSGLLGDPIGLLASPSRLLTGICFVGLLALCTVELVGYYVWHSRAKKAVARGVFLSPPDTATFQKIVLACVLVSTAYYVLNLLFSGDPLRAWLLVLLSGMYLVLFLLTNGVKNWMKRRKAPADTNRAMTTAVSFLLSFALIFGITFGTLQLQEKGFFNPSNAETYEYYGKTWVIHRDRLPLTVEDLVDIDYDGYIRQQSGDESLLLGKLDLYQRPRLDAADHENIPDLSYTMVVVKLPLLYDFCKNRLLEKPGDTRQELTRLTYQQEDASPWGSNSAYRRHDPDRGPENVWLLCYDRVIVEIRFSWEPTQAQKAITGQKLGGMG